jgi:lipoyl(octanoyl) transferase
MGNEEENYLKKVIFEDLGKIDYKQAWDYQESLLKTLVDQKLSFQNKPEEIRQAAVNHLLFCEHNHVYTLGKNGDENNLLLNIPGLKAKKAEFYKINRGGDITYHGPGQLVGYPIFDLEQFKIGLRDYIHLLEESIIRSLKEYHIEADRLEGVTGVWLDPGDKARARKICAIGVRSSRYVTMHGFALNINTDLSYFSFINPCGLKDKEVTSMEKELGMKQDFREVSSLVKQNMAGVFGFRQYI